MGGMLEVIRNALKIPDLRKKLFITIGFLLIYRLGAFIPVPGFDLEKISQILGQAGGMFDFYDIISGGNFKNLSIFAMSITPYINASIIMQLLTVAIPALERMAKEGEEGRKKIAQYIRYGTVVLGFIQAIALFLGLRTALTDDNPILLFLVVTFSFTAGTAFLMWLGEQITEFGIGNGISLIIFAGIVSRAPAGVNALRTQFDSFNINNGPVVAAIFIIIILAVFLLVIAAVVWVTQAERRIPIQYAKRVVGRKMYGGQSTHLPIKVNLAGVIPIIFAMSIMMFPQTIANFIWPDPSLNSGFVGFLKNMYSSPLYPVIYGLLILGFTFFYAFIQFNPVEIANNLKKNGGFIPGIRPGKPTSDYIYKVLNRITLFGGIFLAVITVFPNIVAITTHITGVFFAGTSVLIMVGVALDTVKQIESQMLMRHYKGFLE